MDIWGCHENMRPKEALCHTGQRKVGKGLDFKEKAGDLQVDRKEQTCGKQMFAGPPRNRCTQSSTERLC